MMRNALLGALLVLTAACGAYHFPGGDQAGLGTVSGQLRVYPCAPVEPASGICAPPAVLAGGEIDFSDGQNVFSARADSQGDYTIQLPAATYKVSVKAPERITSGPTTLTVGAGASIVADYVVDSGIRVPVPLPQQ